MCSSGEGTVSAGSLSSVYTGEVRTQFDGIIQIQIQQQQNRHLLQNVKKMFNIIVDSHSPIRAVEIKIISVE